jgi:hypothetical protein
MILLMAQQHINFSQPNDGLGDTLRESQIKTKAISMNCTQTKLTRF